MVSWYCKLLCNANVLQYLLPIGGGMGGRRFNGEDISNIAMSDRKKRVKNDAWNA
jgi:hypothetical protein